MDTVIYLSSEQIRVVTGASGTSSVRVKKFYMTIAPQGSIQDGIVADSDALAGHIAKFWRDNKLPNQNVSVVLNSAQFVGKVIEMPVLGDRAALEYIEREFSNVERMTKPVYSFFPLSKPDKQKRVAMYAEAADSKYIKSYIDLFSKAGIGISSISSSVGGINLYLNRNKLLDGKTSLIQIVSDKKLLSIIYLNGRYFYSDSVQLLNDPETFQYSFEIARTLLRLSKFLTSEQIGEPITDIRYAGLSSGDYENCVENLHQISADVSVSTIGDVKLIKTKTPDEIQYNLFPIGGLFKTEKWRSYLVSYEKLNKPVLPWGEILKAATLPAVLFLILAIVTLTLAGMLYLKNRKLSELGDYIYDPLVLAQITEYDELNDKCIALEKQAALAESIKLNIATYPTINQSVLDVINNCADGLADVTISGFNAAAGMVSVSTRAAEVENIHAYVAVLRQEKMFTSVNYTGYSYQDSDGIWTIHVSCILAEAAGKPEAVNTAATEAEQ